MANQSPTFTKVAYDLGELERLTPYTRQTWTKKINNGELASIKDGRRRLVTHQELMRYFERKQAESTPPNLSACNRGRRADGGAP